MFSDDESRRIKQLYDAPRVHVIREAKAATVTPIVGGPTEFSQTTK